MAEHKGKTYSGIINDGKFELSDGGEFTTPSAAAVHVTGSRVNGWRFWKCKLPGASQFDRAAAWEGTLSPHGSFSRSSGSWATGCWLGGEDVSLAYSTQVSSDC